MILRRLHLHPFAGAPDREIAFAPGLNVVLGPNEAGKTTLRRALRQVLFVPTKLNAREMRVEVEPCLPFSGGDTIRISLEFSVGEAAWQLTKRWARTNSTAELIRPDGGLVTDSTAVEEALGDLLGLGRGTWEHVLIAAQGEVGASLARLDEAGDLRELNARLRRAVFETDGVSLEKLGVALASRLEECFGRWDRVLNRPEGNRGLDQRWSRGAGRIVLAWYEREAARAALERAESYYRRLDELNAALDEAAKADESLAEWVATHEPVQRDAEQRAQLEADLAKVEARGKGLKEISLEWPVVAKEAQTRDELAATLREKARFLGQELARTKAWEDAGKSRRLLEEAERLATAAATARSACEAFGRIEPSEIAALEAIESERTRLRARIEAASLRVRFSAREAILLETKSGVDTPEARALGPGDEVNFEAGGRIVVREATGSWELEVGSGGMDVAAVEARHRELEGEFAARLSSLRVTDLAGARTKLAAAREKAQQAALLESQLAERLGPRSLGELRAEIAATVGDGSEPERPAHVVSGDLGRTESEAAAATRDASALRVKLAAWERDYLSADELLDRLADLRSEHRAAKQRLETLRPLPEGFADAGIFLSEFRRRREALERRRLETHRLQIERAELSRAEPEFEPGEASERLDLATAAFDRVRREGEAVERILRDYEALRTELDSDTLTPWQNHLAEVLAPLTGGRYLTLSPDESSAGRDDGFAIPFDALSAGTRASLGLAVRLTMARWFLEGREGFLVLDDPLVDLDPLRQAAAIALLKHFANAKQVILLTCHPHHAELLGGNTIELK